MYVADVIRFWSRNFDSIINFADLYKIIKNITVLEKNPKSLNSEK